MRDKGPGCRPPSPPFPLVSLPTVLVGAHQHRAALGAGAHVRVRPHPHPVLRPLLQAHQVPAGVFAADAVHHLPPAVLAVHRLVGHRVLGDNAVAAVGRRWDPTYPDCGGARAHTGHLLGRGGGGWGRQMGGSRQMEGGHRHSGKSQRRGTHPGRSFLEGQWLSEGPPGRLQPLRPDSLATPGPQACARRLSLSLSHTHTNGISHTYIWCLSRIWGSNTVPHTHMVSRPKHTRHQAHTSMGPCHPHPEHTTAHSPSLRGQEAPGALREPGCPWPVPAWTGCLCRSHR